MNIAFVGLSGVPYLRRAADNRLMAFAQAYAGIGYKVIVINRNPVKAKVDIKLDQTFSENIKFFEVLDIDKPKNNIINFFIKIISYPIEFYKIIKLNRINKIDLIQIYSGHFFECLIYYSLAKIINAKTIYQYVEFRTSVKRVGIYHKVNSYLFDYYGYKLFDGIIAISNFIINHLKSLHCEVPIIKVPPVCDFNFFDSIEKERITSDYLLFCGSVEYFEVIEQIVESYKLSDSIKNGVQLYLILNGNPKNISKVKKIISEFSSIVIISNLPYKKLIGIYKSARALLIPLRDTIQDTSRFPNKICEYCASKNTIITTKFGEIPLYFNDGENALIASIFSPEAIAAKINEVIYNECHLLHIRKNAYIVGMHYFNISSYFERLEKFTLIVTANDREKENWCNE
ncbi:MAG: glycosyltransferase [Flavobacterium sp.]|uniref:glycosyltransferase n=1 Tax=Flavobacterium sp. TaxID=239 RepID=UPI00261B008F|nr:glycosyltransferase [Flavobacterium sp.]MDD5151730.1 glycosyltransferase [Flavobacterium sp.]